MKLSLSKKTAREDGTGEDLIQGMHRLLTSKQNHNKSLFKTQFSLELPHLKPQTNLAGKKSISKTNAAKQLNTTGVPDRAAISCHYWRAAQDKLKTADGEL